MRFEFRNSIFGFITKTTLYVRVIRVGIFILLVKETTKLQKTPGAIPVFK